MHCNQVVPANCNKTGPRSDRIPPGSTSGYQQANAQMHLDLVWPMVDQQQVLPPLPCARMATIGLLSPPLQPCRPALIRHRCLQRCTCLWAVAYVACLATSRREVQGQVAFLVLFRGSSTSWMLQHPAAAAPLPQPACRLLSCNRRATIEAACMHATCSGCCHTLALHMQICHRWLLQRQ